jgi:hypothetical protein
MVASMAQRIAWHASIRRHTVGALARRDLPGVGISLSSRISHEMDCDSRSHWFALDEIARNLVCA